MPPFFTAMIYGWQKVYGSIFYISSNSFEDFYRNTKKDKEAIKPKRVFESNIQLQMRKTKQKKRSGVEVFLRHWKKEE